MILEPWPSSLSCQRYKQKSIFLILIPSIIKWNWLMCDSVVFFYWKTFRHDISSVPNLDYTYPNPFTPMFTINDVGGRRTWTSHLRHTTTTTINSVDHTPIWLNSSVSCIERYQNVMNLNSNILAPPRLGNRESGIQRRKLNFFQWKNLKLCLIPIQVKMYVRNVDPRAESFCPRTIAFGKIVKKWIF
jgi:hypothetical protein